MDTDSGETERESVRRERKRERWWVRTQKLWVLKNIESKELDN